MSGPPVFYWSVVRIFGPDFLGPVPDREFWNRELIYPWPTRLVTRLSLRFLTACAAKATLGILCLVSLFQLCNSVFAIQFIHRWPLPAKLPAVITDPIYNVIVLTRSIIIFSIKANHNYNSGLKWVSMRSEVAKVTWNWGLVKSKNLLRTKSFQDLVNDWRFWLEWFPFC